MQNSENPNVKHFKLDFYLLSFDKDMKHETYDEPWYYGIIFYDSEGGKYDVIQNYLLGSRLIINNKDGWKDIPFKEATFSFLPPGVEAKVL